jgi:formylglycine-generating enzyme required for sulfatase activity
MGDGTRGADSLDAQPLSVVRLDKDYWMSETEVTNEQYARFDPAHDSRFEHRTSWIFSEEYLGWPLDGPKQPVVRVSWNEATRFAGWLSERAGEAIALPTEAQWEYAARAGSDEAMSYGTLDDDFSTFANMADDSIRDLAYWAWRPKPPDLTPRDDRFNDGALVTRDVGAYQPNAWGLYDMHGNAAEWTRSAYRPYPYNDTDGRNALKTTEERVVRGGSWFDRPKRCRSAFRLNFPAWQPIHNVGFRLAMVDGAGDRATAQK